MTFYIEFAIFTSLGSPPLAWYPLFWLPTGYFHLTENTISAFEPLRWCFLGYEGDYMGLFKEKDDSKKLGLFSFLEENSKKKKDSNLEDWQEKLVEEGKYDSTSFEEEELEEDDYYYEDNE